MNHARLRHVPPSERKIAIVLSAYPTKHSRIGNAVGLDTPVSTVRLLRRMRDAGYDLRSPEGVRKAGEWLDWFEANGVVVEAGAGSGALTCSLLRAVGPEGLQGRGGRAV